MESLEKILISRVPSDSIDKGTVIDRDLSPLGEFERVTSTGIVLQRPGRCDVWYLPCSVGGKVTKRKERGSRFDPKSLRGRLGPTSGYNLQSTFEELHIS